jgi:hypothetical protein
MQLIQDRIPPFPPPRSPDHPISPISSPKEAHRDRTVARTSGGDVSIRRLGGGDRGDREIGEAEAKSTQDVMNAEGSLDAVDPGSCLPDLLKEADRSQPR